MMGNIEDLEIRVQILEKQCQRLKDLEEIKCLKSRYWYCLDNCLWDEIGDCYAEESIIFGVNLRSKKSVGRFFKRISGAMFTASSHQGHNPEIVLSNEDNATGRWQLDQFGIESSSGKSIKLGATYSDTYIKENNQWKIKNTSVILNYRQILVLDKLPAASTRATDG
jgi:hypothetical protein